MKSDLYIAPVQGHTDAAWRHFHHLIYGGSSEYFTPFIRSEHGALRPQDLRELKSPLNSGFEVTPQVIFRNMEELDLLLRNLSELEFKRVDLNMGCPFPLQTGKGRGAGFLSNGQQIELLPHTLAKYPEFVFSAKLRLGYEDPDEWKQVAKILNDVPLKHITMHPRVAKQQYGGDLYLDRFGELIATVSHPVIFNGEIKTPEDVRRVEEQFPQIAGVMTARGVLGRPSLAAEYISGSDWDAEKRISKMMEFHNALFDHYASQLCGDSQILSKIKPFWEYAETEIGRKPWKAIKKATTLAKYKTAVASVGV